MIETPQSMILKLLLANEQSNIILTAIQEIKKLKVNLKKPPRLTKYYMMPTNVPNTTSSALMHHRVVDLEASEPI